MHVQHIKNSYNHFHITDGGILKGTKRQNILDKFHEYHQHVFPDNIRKQNWTENRKCIFQSGFCRIYRFKLSSPLTYLEYHRRSKFQNQILWRRKTV